jgi:Stress responsive A/B Barrel Domain
LEKLHLLAFALDFALAIAGTPRNISLVFSHVVIFWTDPAQPNATEELLAGAENYLKPIPGVLHFHVGKMATSHRPVVDQSYQVALNLVFPSKQAQDDYQVHPLHVAFVEKVFKRVCQKVVVYDFE